MAHVLRVADLLEALSSVNPALPVRVKSLHGKSQQVEAAYDPIINTLVEEDGLAFVIDRVSEPQAPRETPARKQPSLGDAWKGSMNGG